MRLPCLIVLSLACLPTLRAQTITQEEIDRLQAEQYAELDAYFDRQVAEAEKLRAAAWQRDTSSVAAYEKSVEPMREKLWEVYGGKPYDAPALDAKEELLAEFETHNAYRVRLTSFEQVRQYGILLVPKGLKPGERRPALVCVHGMAGTPEGVCGLTEQADYHNRFGQQAAERGYVVLATLNMNNAQKQSWLDRKGTMVGQRMHALEVYKTTRAVDYLCSRADVDTGRIGAYGISWGGRTVMNLAALDRRIAATAISGHFNDLIPKMLTPAPQYTAYIQTAEGYSFFWRHAQVFTDADVVSLICPRAVFIEQGRDDKVAFWEMSQKAFNEVQPLYAALGIADRAVYSIFEGGHEVRCVEAFAFFDEQLKE
ncbi:MAG: alpha/beta hydrolase family protein [Pirellulales bacterium]